MILLSGFSAGAAAAQKAPIEPSFSVIVNHELVRGGWWNDEAYKKNPEPFIDYFVEKTVRETEIKPNNGTVVFCPDNVEKFTVIGQKEGRKINAKSLKNGVKNALLRGKNTVLEPKIDTILPISEAKMIEKIGLRGGYTTYFESNPNRENNIALALSKFNGLCVGKGQTISFNSVVGKRTLERGFEEAKIILDGEFVPGVGGGVCQASTTLFNALLLAGLKIDKSQNHSLLVSYVPIGRDAMVSSSNDLRFTNNTGGTIYIEAGTTDATEDEHGCAWVKIYGDKTHIKYKPRVEVTEMELNEGEIDPARKSITYLDCFNGEEIVHSKIIRKSNYQAVKEKPKPKPEKLA